MLRLRSFLLCTTSDEILFGASTRIASKCNWEWNGSIERVGNAEENEKKHDEWRRINAYPLSVVQKYVTFFLSRLPWLNVDGMHFFFYHIVCMQCVIQLCSVHTLLLMDAMKRHWNKMEPERKNINIKMSRKLNFYVTSTHGVQYR